jgi:hypothetical protein
MTSINKFKGIDEVKMRTRKFSFKFLTTIKTLIGFNR